MGLSFLQRIDPAGHHLDLDEAGLEAALRQGEALHREFRPHIGEDYFGFIRQMAAEGAGVVQLVDEGEVRAIAVWRTLLTTYAGRRMEVDDLVTAEGQRSKGYGAAVLKALEVTARANSCHVVMLNSATHRVDAHRFYLRERYAIGAFQFVKRV